jgi:hypothetical protein
VLQALPPGSGWHEEVPEQDVRLLLLVWHLRGLL